MCIFSGFPVFLQRTNPILFMDSQAQAVGRGAAGVGFVEGDPRKPVGVRVLLSLARVLEGLLLNLRKADSAVRPYTDVILRCLVTLFLAEEGFLAVGVSETNEGHGTNVALTCHSCVFCEQENKGGAGFPFLFCSLSAKFSSTVRRLTYSNEAFP